MYRVSVGKGVGLAPQTGPSDSIPKVKLCFPKSPIAFQNTLNIWKPSVQACESVRESFTLKS